MNHKKLRDVPPTWEHKSWAMRLNDAATALAMWGLLTSKERENVHARMMKRAINERIAGSEPAAK